MARRIFSKKNVLYLLYGLVLFCALAYFRFPAEKFRQYIEWKADKQLTDYTLRIGAIGFRFPAKLEIFNVTVTKTDSETAVPLKLSRLQLAPAFSERLASIWRTLELSGQFENGSFHGNIAIDPEKKRFALHNFNGMALSTAPLVSLFLDRSITGSLELRGVEYEAGLGEPHKGNGQGEIILRDGEMTLLTPVFAMDVLAFNEVTVVFSMASGLIDISAGTCYGKELLAGFTGNVLVADPLAASGLQLLGDIDFTPEFLVKHKREAALMEKIMKRFETETLPFKIGGDLNRPSITFEL